MKMKKLIASTFSMLLVLGLAVALTGCGQQKETQKPENILRYGLDAAYRPFEFRNEENKIVGFDVDIMEAVAKELGMETEAVDTAWDGIIPALLNGKFDVIASALTITPERAGSVDFSQPYFKSGQAIAVRVNETGIRGPEQLSGKTIGVQINSTGDIAATEKVKNAKDIKRYNAVPDILVALGNKELDAAVMDAPVALEYNKANPGKIIILDQFLTQEEFGLAVKKGNQELVDKINQALDRLKANGEYDKIYEKWFGKKQ